MVSLGLRVQFFVHDLLNFEEKHLTSGKIEHGHCLSDFYFTADEATKVLNHPMPCADDTHPTVRSALENATKAAADAKRYDICTAHTIAPILMKAFVLVKGFNKTPAFIRSYRQWLRSKGIRI